MSKDNKSKFVSVDCGKYNTKFDSLIDGSIKSATLRTKMSPGQFDDDMLEKYSYIVRVDDGETYKIGQAATRGAELETSKQTEIHKVCTMSAIAMHLGQSTDKVNVGIGIPFLLGTDAAQRNEYKDYILPPDHHKVEIKRSASSDPIIIEFDFDKRYVFPEGAGVLYEYPELLSDISGVIDIGNLNLNALYSCHLEPMPENSFTDEIGGNRLISNLSRKLSSSIGMRVDDQVTAAVLKKEGSDRCLVPRNGDENVIQTSREIIDSYLMEFAEDIKAALDSRQWPTGFMSMVAIGGTPRLFKKELSEVFPGIFIPDMPDHVNAKGVLRRICQLNGIDLSQYEVSDSQ